MPIDNQITLDEFTNRESERNAEILSLCSKLRKYHNQQFVPTWPIDVLPNIARALFSDCACFVSIKPDGSLHIVMYSENDCLIQQGRPYGQIWNLCKGKIDKPIMEMHCTSKTFDKLGIVIPDRSSLMFFPIASQHRPESCIGVWRSAMTDKPISAEPYQSWDVQAFNLITHLLSLTVDVTEYLREVVRLQSIQTTAQAFIEVIKPRIFGLQEMTKEVPPEQRSKLCDSLRDMNIDIDQIQRTLILGGSKI